MSYKKRSPLSEMSRKIKRIFFDDLVCCQGRGRWPLRRNEETREIARHCLINWSWVLSLSLFLHRSNQRGKGHKTRSQSGRLVTLSKIFFFLKKKGKINRRFLFAQLVRTEASCHLLHEEEWRVFRNCFFFFFRWDNNKKKGVKIKKKTNRTMGLG